MLTLILAAINLAALAALAWRYRQLHTRASGLSRQIADLAPAAALAAPGMDPQFAGGPDAICIRILNPMELAARESRLAELFGNLSPSLIRKLVYERTQKTLVEDLKKYGVEAQVSLHHGAR